MVSPAPVPRSVYDLLKREWGVAVSYSENPDATSVGVTSVIIARNNPRRVGLIIINLSANTLYLRPGSPATSATGIEVPPDSGLSLAWTDDMLLQAIEWHAIASGAASATYTLEVLID